MGSVEGEMIKENDGRPTASTLCSSLAEHKSNGKISWIGKHWSRIQGAQDKKRRKCSRFIGTDSESTAQSTVTSPSLAG